jgi:hypothetical protein
MKYYLAFFLLLVGCGESNLERLQSGGGCSAEDAMGTNGQCPNQEESCTLSYVDRDGLTTNGCESLLSPEEDDALSAIEPGGVLQFSINDFGLDSTLAGGWVALGGEACAASQETPCRRNLDALQMASAAFEFDGIWWTDGLLELPKPLPVEDAGEGFVVPAGADVVGSFVVGGEKRIVSRGTTPSWITVKSDTTGATITGSISLSFGEYAMTGNLTARATLVASAPDAGAP